MEAAINQASTGIGLWEWACNDQPGELDNVLIKVPATPSGIEAFFRLTVEGISVNVTLIFSRVQYEAVVQAHQCGAIRWLESGGQRLPEPRRYRGR